MKDLQLVLCSLNDEGADLFAPHLANNSSLRKLNLSNNWNITTAGWRAIFTHLQSPQSLLEELLLWGNLIDDDNANLLAASLANNTHLRVLNLTDGIECSRITNEGLVSFANSLMHNSTLKELLFDGVSGSNNNIFTEGWRALSNVLCKLGLG